MIGIISNAASGHNRDQFEQLSRQLDQLPGATHLRTQSAEDIGPALTQLNALKCRYLVINGGDGTVSAVLGHALEHRLFDQFPQILILPGGTANMTAGDVGIKGKLARAVSKLQRWASDQQGGMRVHRNLMRVDVPGDGVHYGMFLGAGAVIQGTEYAHREIHSRGLRDDFSVGLGALRTVWGLVRGEEEFTRPVPLNLDMPSLQLQSHHDCLILAVSSLERLFLGMKPFWGTQQGGLQLSIIESGCSRFLTTFFSIARGKANRHAQPENGYFSYRCDELSLSMDAMLNLDGEILTSSAAAGAVKISASQTLSFIRL